MEGGALSFDNVSVSSLSPAAQCLNNCKDWCFKIRQETLVGKQRKLTVDILSHIFTCFLFVRSLSVVLLSGFLYGRVTFCPTVHTCSSIIFSFVFGVSRVQDVQMSCFLSISTHLKLAFKFWFNSGIFIINISNQLEGSVSGWTLIPENSVIALDRMRETQVDLNMWARQHFGWSLGNLFYFTEVNPCRQRNTIL